MKAMKNKLRKFLLMLYCGLLLMSLSVGVTVAYLTDTDSVKNTFTVGKVDITMDENLVDTETGKIEPGITDRVTENEYKIVPGRTIDKDPVIRVQPGSEESWLFIKIENGLAAIEAASETGENGYKTIAEQLVANGWKAVEGAEGVVYAKVAAANTAEGAGVVPYPTFTQFKVKGDIANAAIDEYEGKKINVTAYAVQYEGFEENVAGAWAAISDVEYGVK